MTDDSMPAELRRVLHPEDPRRLVARGHPVGDVLEAYDWEVLHRSLGRLRVSAHLPPVVRNPRGQLFGGFTGTYVDFMSIFTFWAGREPDPGERRRWLTTLNMRIDYFRPVTGPRFEMEGRVVQRSGKTGTIETRFHEAGAPEGAEPLVFGYATLRIVD